MRRFRPVVPTTALPRTGSRQDDSLRCAIAAKLVGGDRTRPASCDAQTLPKETRRRQAVSLGRHSNVDHRTVLLHPSPAVRRHAVALLKHFVEEPSVADLRACPFQRGGLSKTESVTPKGKSPRHSAGLPGRPFSIPPLGSTKQSGRTARRGAK